MSPFVVDFEESTKVTVVNPTMYTRNEVVNITLEDYKKHEQIKLVSSTGDAVLCQIVTLKKLHENKTASYEHLLFFHNEMDGLAVKYYYLLRKQDSHQCNNECADISSIRELNPEEPHQLENQHIDVHFEKGHVSGLVNKQAGTKLKFT